MKKAVIIGVGANQGLGSQLAKRFAAEGLHVFIAGRTLSRIQERASEIQKAGGKATAICADASDEKQVIELFKETENESLRKKSNEGV